LMRRGHFAGAIKGRRGRVDGKNWRVHDLARLDDHGVRTETEF
jgi:hypothetical protein